MSYSNDVFISYRRESYAWTPWARDEFRRALRSCLQRELGHPANVFIDEQIPTGTNYVEYLARSLATSKTMVALWSRDYFSSDWCVHELDLMVERSKECDAVIPVLVHDGEIIPDEVANLQRADFKKFANPALSRAGLLYVEFWDAVEHLAVEVAAAIQAAPTYNAAWEGHFKQRLTEVYDASKLGTRLAPKSFILKSATPPRTPPRLVP